MGLVLPPVHILMMLELCAPHVSYMYCMKHGLLWYLGLIARVRQEIKVKDKLTSCTMTGHASIIFELTYTSACPE